MSVENQAINVAPPRADFSANTRSWAGVYSRASAATSQRYVIPPAAKGNYLSIKVTGEEMQFAFGGSGVVVAMNANSTLATETLTPNVNTGYPVAPGETVHFYLPNDEALTHFAAIAAGTNGRFFAYISNNVVG